MYLRSPCNVTRLSSLLLFLVPTGSTSTPQLPTVAYMYVLQLGASSDAVVLIFHAGSGLDFYSAHGMGFDPYVIRSLCEF
jgi:hypothetical protein